MTPDFARSKRYATQLLLKQKLETTLINAKDLDLDFPVYFDTIQNYCKTVDILPSQLMVNGNLPLGWSLRKQGYCVVLYNDKLYGDRLNWTIAHEIGHIYLGHDESDPVQEIEAHFFAAQILSPEVAIRQIWRRNGDIAADDVNEFFKVSYTAAQKRVNLIKRTSCIITKEDKAILEMLEQYINELRFDEPYLRNCMSFMYAK
ncbi:ImmA/IrrE family metallo-endopeptidase [Hydrogenoanaerobacterium sp.]|uniref:ImmA/IrrE family metallo-endopeptidase n=1 Tax=Hydrogenoanaerobacterium sp. TaxID=2953763 RepID=UPI0028A286A6|nr:ImmA/IrrE family metallo-endopeptidase [Hydrogenoanaerobacterium sp.]